MTTGKSGSGKSNTASVLCEELLDEGIPLMIVDTDGEYYGLKEEYEMLHVGGDERCDLRIGPQHAEKIAEITLGSNVPIILDVSGFIEESDSKRLVHDVVRELFVKEKQAKVPYLLLIEEAHEFIPESGGLDEVGEMLVRVAKRGRKRGLGVCAMSQRPASVSKDFITQCDWIVWHRLTWKNDTQVVSRIMGSQTADEVQNLEPGEAIMLADWEDEPLRVKFRRKRTLDAGATPDLDGIDDSQTNSVRSDIVDELEDAGASLTETGAEAEWDADDADDHPGDTAPTQQVATDSAPDGSESNEPAASESTLEEIVASESAAPEDGQEAESSTDSSPTAPTSEERGLSTGSEGPLDTTEDALERAARNVAAGESVSGSAGRPSDGSDSADGDSDDRNRPDPDPAEDPVWEVAEFVAYLIGAFAGALFRLGATVERTVGQLAGLTTGSTGHPGRPGYSTGDDRPVVGIVVAAILFGIGLVIGIGVMMLI